MGRLRRLADFAFFTALVVAALPVAAGRSAVPAPAGATIYCCDDAKGRRVCGDILPATCYSSSYREISPRGTIRREVAPPPTAEEVARLKQQELRRQEMEERQLKQRRLDSALLQTYVSVADLDARRDRAVGEIEHAIAVLNERERALTARREQLEGERAGKKVAASALEADLRAVDNELEAQRAVIAAKTRERDGLRAKFDDERRRYLELTGAADAGR